MSRRIPKVWTPNLDYLAKRLYREFGAMDTDELCKQFKKQVMEQVDMNRGAMPPDQHLYLALFCRAASFQFIDVMVGLRTKLKHRIGQKKQYDTWKAFTPFHTVTYPDASVGYNIDKMVEAIDVIKDSPVNFSPLTLNARGENAVAALWANKELKGDNVNTLYMRMIHMTPSIAKSTFISIANKVSEEPTYTIKVNAFHCLLSAPDEVLEATAARSLVIRPNRSVLEPNVDARNMISLLASIIDDPPRDTSLQPFFDDRDLVYKGLKRTWTKTVFRHLQRLEQDTDDDVDKNAIAILLGQLATHETIRHTVIKYIEEIMARKTAVAVSQVVRFLTQSRLMPPNLVNALSATSKNLGSRANFMVKDWLEGAKVKVEEEMDYGDMAYQMVSARKGCTGTDEEVDDFAYSYERVFKHIAFGEIAPNIVFGICEVASTGARATVIKGIKQLMDTKKISGVEAAMDDIIPDDLVPDCPDAVTTIREMRKQLGLRFQLRATASEFIPFNYGIVRPCKNGV